MINIGTYQFEGPYEDAAKLEDRSGVYAILDYRGNEYRLLDCGESSTVKTRVAGHDRRPCWIRNSIGRLCYAVYYTPNLQQSGRMEVEQAIRKQYNPTCGDR